MKIYEVAYMSNYGGFPVYKNFKAADEAGARKKAERYCDNAILRITEVAV